MTTGGAETAEGADADGGTGTGAIAEGGELAEGGALANGAVASMVGAGGCDSVVAITGEGGEGEGNVSGVGGFAGAHLRDGPRC